MTVPVSTNVVPSGWGAEPTNVRVRSAFCRNDLRSELHLDTLRLPGQPLGGGMRRNEHGDESDPLYRRNRRLGWTSAGLAAAAVVALGLGAALLSTDWFSGILNRRQVDIHVGTFLTIQIPGGAVLVAAALFAVALVFLAASVEVAFASQILAAKRRRVPWPDAAQRWALGRQGVTPAGFHAAGEAPESLHITVVIPAHDEETTIGAAIDSLRAQRRPPDEIVVVDDRCTDRTAAVAEARAAVVLRTRDNLGRKAGALNQALAELLPGMAAGDAVLVMDADTVLAPEFIAEAESRLLEDPALQAVGGIFFGEGGSGLVGQLQRSEYVRYARTIARRKGRRVTVLSGTGSLFRADALRTVAEQRGRYVPGTRGQVYDPFALTEDNELTLALRTLGARLVSPRECRTITEVMPTWRHLWRQRIRWDRGALENLATYGLTLATLRSWWQQAGLAYATLALNLYLLLVFVTWRASDHLALGLTFWIVVTCIFVVERVVSVWRGGWRGRLLALPLVVELAYAEVILVVFVVGLVDAVRRRRADWGHVDRAQLARQGALLAPLVCGPVITVSTLSSPWFQALSLVVGFNTVLYAVLALLNLVPRRQA